MRILFFSSVFPQPHNPLRGIYSLYLCRALSRTHAVTVVAPWSWVDRLRYNLRGTGIAQGEAPELEQFAIRYPSYYYPPRVMRSTYGWWMWGSVRKTMQSVLSRFQPECIVSYWTFPDGEVAVRAAREHGIPCAVMVGGSDVLLMTQCHRRKKQISRVLNEADAVVPVGADLRESILRLGIPIEKTHIVPRGVDTTLFSPGNRQEARRRLGIPERKQVLLYVGNMVPLKGIDVLLAACELLFRENADLQLYLIGDGSSRNQLETESHLRGIASITRFIGPVAHSTLPNWYRAANVTVLPSRSEGVPNVLRESLACGTPFVASRVGGIPELAKDPISTLVPPENPAALAAGISRTLATHGESIAPPKIRNSWDDSAARLTGILASLVERLKSTGLSTC